MRTITGTIYRNILKPILFKFPADCVHALFLWIGWLLGKSPVFRAPLRWMWRYKDAILSQTLEGLSFPNPVGLAAGFDYNADLVRILPEMGFGFHTVGTLTHEPYAGNPRPMLGRLPRSRSLLVNKGFKNEGIKNVLRKLKQERRAVPLGVSVGATNKPYPDFTAMVADLAAGFREADSFKNFDYFELNISCPNLVNLENLPERLDSPRGLEMALDELQKLGLQRPVFIKMPLERTIKETGMLAEIAARFPFVKGLIFANLAKNRNNPALDPQEVQAAGRGNFSGKPTEAQCNELISFAYRSYGERFIIIGVGGIFSAKDAYRKIKMGASLVQLITGMVYMGPQLIGDINKELTELLRKDGYKNISEAVGSAA